ncbi:MAG TPA: histidine phosphatase family protein [Acidimicrobiales bacterium]|nr:histidine phosphatase family protein [Acidimicrobiales bacterium]
MILLVRHGQTAANAAGLLLGRSDPPLTDLGRRQAVASAKVLGGVTRVVTSPLRRARETADAFGAAVPVEVDERWTELDYGDFEGRPFNEVPSTTWQRWRSDATFTPPGGESLAVLGRRVRDACEHLAGDARSGGGDVAVISHVSPIKAAVAWALAVEDTVAWRMFLDQASITRVAIGDHGPSLRSYNETHHLLSL